MAALPAVSLAPADWADLFELVDGYLYDHPGQDAATFDLLGRMAEQLREQGVSV